MFAHETLIVCGTHKMPELCAATLVNRATAESAPQAGWPCSLHNEPSPGLSPRDNVALLAKPHRPLGAFPGATGPGRMPVQVDAPVGSA